MEIENQLNIFKSVIDFLNHNEELKQIFSGIFKRKRGTTTIMKSKPIINRKNIKLSIKKI